MHSKKGNAVFSVIFYERKERYLGNNMTAYLKGITCIMELHLTVHFWCVITKAM